MIALSIVCVHVNISQTCFFRNLLICTPFLCTLDSLSGIFDGMRSAAEHIEFTVRLSIVEIYMEKIRCLMNPAQNNLSVREDKVRAPFCECVRELCL